jgi:ribosomal 50S subunit-recycling heat shock protein
MDNNDEQIQKQALPGSDINLDQPSPLEIKVLKDKTLGDIFEEALNSANIAEKETLNQIRNLSELLERERNDKTEVELAMLITPIIKDFLTEYSSQSETKVKIATAIANIIKTKDITPKSVTQTNISINGEQSSKKSVTESDEFKNTDILEPSFNKKKQVKVINKDESQTDGSNEGPITVIHSEGYIEEQK